MIYITAVRPASPTSYHGLTHYRWLDSSDGKAGTTGRAGMIKFLEEGKKAQVAGEDGPSVVAVYESNGTKYLRTHADGSWNNNLESLPRF